MKTCSKCKLPKDESEFNKRGNGLQPQCRECSNKSLKEDYIENKQRYLDKAKRNKQKYLTKFEEYKKSLFCTDCGVSFKDCWWMCDFHHTDSKEKDFSIAKKKGNLTLDSLKEELDKCVPLCANCHRTRHHMEVLV